MPPSAQSLPSLLTKVRSMLPPSLPRSASFILPASTLTALGHPNLLGPLFTNVIQTSAPPRASSPSAHAQQISHQLRDLLLKEWTLIGIPLVITAAASLATAERASNLFPPTPPALSAKYASGSPFASTAPGSPTAVRGERLLNKLYRHNLPAILRAWGSCETDLTWLEKSVIYGLFLSDHTVLGEVETELVTLSSIVAQGLEQPAKWHVRGLRRLGVPAQDVARTVEVVGECARWAGRGEEEGRQWVRWAEEVESEVGQEIGGEGAGGGAGAAVAAVAAAAGGAA